MRVSPLMRTSMCTSLACILGVFLAAAASVVSADSDRGPTLDVANPRPGDLLTPGVMIIQGVAYDDSAEQGSGVDRVSIFIGNRDQGALRFLGDARLGLHNPQSVEHGDPQFAQAGWSLTTPVLRGGGQERELYIYARSSVSGTEAVEVIPVIMGEQSVQGAPGEEGGSEE